ncbi:MMPL family transporter, partial [Mycobacterium kansasii]
LIFQYGLGKEIAWPVPLLAFIILVAVGADYNMLLISRLREESTRNIRVGVLRTVANTGSVITSAGLIFAASMFGLMVGSIAIMIQ